MKAQDLAANCGGCFATGSYDLGYQYQNCLGNKFDTTKSTDNTVNCGECATNANSQNCGGTAVITPNEGANVYSGASMSSYSAANYQWCGRNSCTTTGGYSVMCDTYDTGYWNPVNTCNR